MVKRTVMLVVVSVFSAIAHAEGGCPAGMIPHAGTSTTSCAPIPQGPQGENGPPINWASRWGAIASDGKTGTVGAVTSRASKNDARRAAIAECEARGGNSCKVETTYRNQCLAVISGSSKSNNVTAESVERATQIGMESCEKRGDSNCRVYYSGCSFPERTR